MNQMRVMQGFKGLVVLCVVLLAGCTGDLLRSKVDEPASYVLRANKVATANVAWPVTISVALPHTAPGLDTDRIAVLRQQVLDYYAGVRWSGDAAQVVQSFLVSYLQATQGFKNVSSDSVAVDADYSLTLELRDFQAEYTGSDAPAVRVTLTGALMDIKQRRMVAVLQTSRSVAAGSNHLDAVITAFNQALQQGSEDVVAQMQRAMPMAQSGLLKPTE